MPGDDNSIGGKIICMIVSSGERLFGARLSNQQPTEAEGAFAPAGHALPLLEERLSIAGRLQRSAGSPRRFIGCGRKAAVLPGSRQFG